MGLHLGSLGGQLLNGAEGGGDNASSNNVGSTICDNNTTNNNYANNRSVTGQNTPDGKKFVLFVSSLYLSNEIDIYNSCIKGNGTTKIIMICRLCLEVCCYIKHYCLVLGCGLSDNPGSTSSSGGGGGITGQTNANHNLNPLSNGQSASLDDGSGNALSSCLNNTGSSNMNTGNGNNHLNSSLEDVKPSHLGSSSNSSTPQHQVGRFIFISFKYGPFLLSSHFSVLGLLKFEIIFIYILIIMSCVQSSQVLNTLPNDSDNFLDAFDTKEEGTFCLYDARWLEN